MDVQIRTMHARTSAQASLLAGRTLAVCRALADAHAQLRGGTCPTSHACALVLVVLLRSRRRMLKRDASCTTLSAHGCTRDTVRKTCRHQGAHGAKVPRPWASLSQRPS